LCKV